MSRKEGQIRVTATYLPWSLPRALRAPHGQVPHPQRHLRGRGMLAALFP
jgi:hypothetical protein